MYGDMSNIVILISSLEKELMNLMQRGFDSGGGLHSKGIMGAL